MREEIICHAACANVHIVCSPKLEELSRGDEPLLSLDGGLKPIERGRMQEKGAA